MSNALSTFTFNTASIRVVTIEGEPWFVAADVCRVLGFDVGAGKSTTSYLRTLADDEKQSVRNSSTLSFGNAPQVTAISESGLYKLIMRAHRSNPAASQFQDWVTREVLPAIRKDGSYVMGEEKVRSGEMSEDELILKAMTALKTKVERVTAERDILAAEYNRVTVDEYRASRHEYWDHAFSVKVGMLATSLCKIKGLPLEKQARKLHRNGRDITVHPNVYDREILDAALAVLQ